MKKDVGVLIERIDRMRDDVAGLSTKMDATVTKVDGINLKLAWLAGICAGITGLVLIVWAVVTQVPWTDLINKPNPPATQQAAPPAIGNQAS